MLYLAFMGTMRMIFVTIFRRRSHLFPSALQACNKDTQGTAIDVVDQASVLMQFKMILQKRAYLKRSVKGVDTEDHFNNKENHVERKKACHAARSPRRDILVECNPK